jgi:hypothetical protein
MTNQLSKKKLYHLLFMILTLVVSLIDTNLIIFYSYLHTRAINYNSISFVEFVLTEEAIDILKNIDGPIGLVAVAGMYRTGKSYLLNRMLLNRSNGFGVGPSINPCTKV